MEDNKPIFICDFKNCERIFTTKYSLIRHNQTHLKKKSFKCKQCSKTFNIKQNLIEHEFVHTGEQPYVWNIGGCTQRFRQRGKLSLHRQSHSNYKKKNYRSHTSINDGDLSRRVQIGHPVSPPTWVSTVQIQNLPQQTPITPLNASNTGMFIMNNPVGKMSQLACNQSLLSLSQNLPNRNYQFLHQGSAPVRFLNGQMGQPMRPQQALPKLNLVMLPYQGMGSSYK